MNDPSYHEEEEVPAPAPETLSIDVNEGIKTETGLA